MLCVRPLLVSEKPVMCYHITNQKDRIFEHAVADSLKGSRPIKDIIEEICQIKDGQFAIKACNEFCALYSLSSSEDAKIEGYDIIAAACVAIHEIDRLVKLGIISVFQVNERESVVIGNSNLCDNQATSYSISNKKLAEHLKMDAFGGERLDRYINNGYKTDAEILSIKNLKAAQSTLKCSIITIIVSVVVFIVTIFLSH